MCILPDLNLTFDDVLLLPQKSNILPKDVEVKTYLAKNLYLNIPLISADMDTVTESKLAIALSRLGGLGIIHKNLSPDNQAEEVYRVKRSESAFVTDPITLCPNNTIADALEIMKQNNISGIPITENGKLKGILTIRDIRFAKNAKTKISKYMTKKVITAPTGTNLKKAEQILHKHRIEKLPIVDKKGNLKGLITFKDINKIIQWPKAVKDKKGRLKVGSSIGVGEEAMERAKKSVNAGADILVISTAHGHSRGVIETVRQIRKKYPKIIIMAGNVATKEGTKDLANAGAQIIKVGIGPGSICTTRIVTGVGIPQLSTVLNCSKEAKKLNVSIVADGGIRYSGDITKAIAAGADAVMIGSLFAGTEEAPGELIYFKGKAYKSYRGMGSIGALKRGSLDRYNQVPGKLVPEGVEGRVIYKGPLKNVVDQLIGGLKSGMGLCGAKNMKELHKKAKFIRITPQAVEESHPHNILITEEAPNYPGKI
ncbi:IMP dehydrogenase [bacterium]|nr:IMP dehydrogenase [bacterium]